MERVGRTIGWGLVVVVMKVEVEGSRVMCGGRWWCWGSSTVGWGEGEAPIAMIICGLIVIENE